MPDTTMRPPDQDHDCGTHREFVDIDWDNYRWLCRCRSCGACWHHPTDIDADKPPETAVFTGEPPW